MTGPPGKAWGEGVGAGRAAFFGFWANWDPPPEGQCQWTVSWSCVPALGRQQHNGRTDRGAWTAGRSEPVVLRCTTVLLITPGFRVVPACAGKRKTGRSWHWKGVRPRCTLPESVRAPPYHTIPYPPPPRGWGWACSGPWVVEVEAEFLGDLQALAATQDVLSHGPPAVEGCLTWPALWRGMPDPLGLA